MRNFRLAASLILTGLALIIFPALPAFAVPSGLYLNLPGSVEVGSTFNVELRLNTSQEVDSMHVGINYPASLLTFVSISPGVEPFEYVLANSGSAAGTVTLERFSLTGAPAGITGDNSIATITFKAKDTGTAGITFDPSTSVVRGGSDVAVSKVNASTSLVHTPAPPPPDPAPGAVFDDTIDTSIFNSTATSSAGSSSNQSSSSSSQTSATSSSSTSIDSSGAPANSNSLSVYGVTVTILDQHGKPIKGAKASIESQALATSDSKGRVSFKGLAPGDYLLSIAYKGNAYSSAFKVVSSNELVQAKNVKIHLAAKHVAINKIVYPVVLLAIIGGVLVPLFRRRLPATPLPSNTQSPTAGPDSAPSSNSDIYSYKGLPVNPPSTIIEPANRDKNE